MEKLEVDALGEVRAWATNGWHGSYRSKSRARLLKNKRLGVLAAEILVEADIPGLEWLLKRHTLLTELGRCRQDQIVDIARVLVRARPLVVPGCRLVRRLSGRSLGAE